MTDPLRVLFVCTANVCRSPLAEALANHHAREFGLNLEANSAGVHDEIRTTHPWILAELESKGLDLGRTTSQPLTRERVDAADVILTMTGSHAIEVAARFRHALPKVFMIDHFARAIRAPEPNETIDEWLRDLDRIPRSYPSPPDAEDVPDPIGRSDAVFRRVADQLDALTSHIAATLSGRG